MGVTSPTTSLIGFRQAD